MREVETQEQSVISKKVGVWATWLLGGSCFALVGICVPFVLPALRKHCLPFVPASQTQIEKVLLHLRGRTGKVVDIGSGDGRVVIEAAKAGHYAIGYELNTWLVMYSKWKALLSGVHTNTEFHNKDLWKVDFSQYSTIVFFGVQSMMEPLGKKISEDLREARDKRSVASENESHRVIACRFQFPGRTPTVRHDLGHNSVWVYDNFT